MNSYSGAERRRYQRANANFLVSYRNKCLDENYNLTQTQNISQGGALLTTSKVFDRGDVLSMLIQFPFLSQRVGVLGKVVRQKEVVKDFFYETGVEFIGLENKVFGRIGEFVEAHQDKSGPV